MTPDTELTELRQLAVVAAQAAAELALRWQGSADLVVEEKSAVYDLVSQADRECEQAVAAVLRQARPQDGVLGEEGGPSGVRAGRVVWVVDPIDGTTNYLYGLDAWAVSVAAVECTATTEHGPRLGRVLAAAVLEPATGRTTSAHLGGGTLGNGRPAAVRRTADLRHSLVDIGFGGRALRPRVGRLTQRLAYDVRDVRRGGSAATALAMVATGRVEAYWGPGVSAWDIAAGALLVTEAGGTVGDLRGPAGGGLPTSGTCLASGPGLFDPLRALLQEVYADEPA